jgi:hypothetical protein
MGKADNETVVDLGGKGQHELELGEVVVSFDYDVHERGFKIDHVNKMMMPESFLTVVLVESVAREGEDLPGDEALSWVRENVDDLLEKHLDNQLAVFESWGDA